MYSFYDKILFWESIGFLTQIINEYGIVDISTTKKIIRDTESINMWI